VGYGAVTKRCHNGTMPETQDHEPPACAASDTAAEVVRWLTYLGAERRMSPKTVEAYRRDVFQFLAFMAEHLGGRPALPALAQPQPPHPPAFMAAARVGGPARALGPCAAACAPPPPPPAPLPDHGEP